MDTGLTSIDEKDIAKHLSTAQSLVTKFVMTKASDGKSRTEIAGTRRRFVSTVSTAGMRSTHEVEFSSTLSSVAADDSMLSPIQHTILFKTRRALSVALAVGDEFAKHAAAAIRNIVVGSPGTNMPIIPIATNNSPTIIRKYFTTPYCRLNNFFIP